jgi:hypothetical protein
MTSGNLAGFPVVDVTATLNDGSYHEVDSSALAFQIAARGAFREAMQKCGARLLEPVMKVRCAHQRAVRRAGLRGSSVSCVLQRTVGHRGCAPPPPPPLCVHLACVEGRARCTPRPPLHHLRTRRPHANTRRRTKHTRWR